MPGNHEIDALIQQGVARKLYDNALLIVGDCQGVEKIRCDFGPDQFFDVASLTKIFVTAPVIAHFFLKKFSQEDLDIVLLAEIFPKACRNMPWAGKLSVKRVLQHKAGLRAWRAFFLRSHFSEAFLEEEAFLAQFRPTSDLYSDVGFLLLSYMMLSENQTSIYEYFVQEIAPDFFGSFFFRREDLPEKRDLQDDNARFLSQSKTWCGHAGLFCSRELRLESLKRLFFDLPSSRFLTSKTDDLLGFRSGNDAATNVFGNGHAFGHYGFSGCFFWVDPVQEKMILLFTDRFKKSFIPSQEWREHRKKLLAACHKL